MKILDVCCSNRSMYFDKDNPHVIHCDKRVEDITLSNNRSCNISPDVQHDFTAMPFADQSFEMIVWDPPHLSSLGNNSIMAQRYGKLFPGWEDDIHAGFDECWRVLKYNGTLIFKWNEFEIKLKQILELAPDPLFGHSTGSKSKTKWITFVKFT